MATLAELQDRLDRLRRQRASGPHEVAFDEGRRVVYKPDEQMAAAIADLERQIATYDTRPVTTILVTATKGLDA
jgi:hypothetical protein